MVSSPDRAFGETRVVKKKVLEPGSTAPKRIARRRRIRRARKSEKTRGRPMKAGR